MILDKNTRDAIGRVAGRLRRLFEREFRQQATGRYGIHVSPQASDGPDDIPETLRPHIEPPVALALSPQEVRQRAELLGALSYLVHEGATGQGAVEQLLREAAFTSVNRLLAARVAETIGVLPAAIGGGRQSAGYRDIVTDLFPALRQEDDEGFWLFLQACGDELGAAVPLLFDRRLPTSAFVPSRPCIDEALRLINDVDVAEAWREPEALGWAYQFFNSDEERADLRLESAAPRNPRELAVRNQFFTPRYVVDWLVQNTLGCRLREGGLKVTLPLLAANVGRVAPVDLDDVRVLDPAVGSGHFLLACYDLLEEAWQTRGVPPAESAGRILSCLHGIEIDWRAAQVAQTVLLLRARSTGSQDSLEPPDIVTARPAPRALGEQVDDFFSPTSLVGELGGALVERLAFASRLGFLLKAEQMLQTDIQEALRRHPRLSASHPPPTEAALEDAIIRAIDTLAAEADSSAGVRMFSAEARDAVRFVKVCRRRYDVIVMNPPFGDSIDDESRSYLKTAYPKWWTELYACFVSRSLELLREGGLIGALTSSQWLMTRKMRSFRGFVAERCPPRAVVDLGSGVLAGATVNTAMAVFRPDRGSVLTSYVDLVREDPVTRERRVTCLQPDDYRTIGVATFEDLPRIPFPFHVPDTVLELWRQPGRLEPSVATVRTGNNTFDNFRFIRCRWELPFDGKDAGWTPYQKGGEYKPYLEPSHLLLDWREEGSAMKGNAKLRVGGTAQVRQSSKFWGKPGLTAPRVSSVGFGARLLPAGEIFSGDAISFFPADGVDLRILLAVLNATAFAEIVRVFGRSRKTENGALKAMPVDKRLLVALGEQGVTRFVERIVALSYRHEARDETSAYFLSPIAYEGPTSGAQARRELNDTVQELSRLQRELDRLVGGAFGVRGEQVVDPDVARRPALAPSALRHHSAPARTWALDMVGWAVGMAFGRWSQDPPEQALPRIGDLMRPLPVAPPGFDGRGTIDIIPGEGSGSLARLVLATLERIDSGMPDAVRQAMKVNSLQEWIARKFFSEHVRRYSRSRRYAPIYWQLSVPSRGWSLWIYVHAMTRDTLFGIARAADVRRRECDERARLVRGSESKLGRRSREEIERVESLATELGVFAGHAHSVADSGWVPDLNDGVVLVAAPLAPLFQDRYWLGKLTREREALEEGSYPWATVQSDYFGIER